MSLTVAFQISTTVLKHEIRLHVSIGFGGTNEYFMTVQELVIVLSQKKDFTGLLWGKVRALAEEGDFNKSIFEMK